MTDLTVSLPSDKLPPTLPINNTMEPPPKSESRITKGDQETRDCSELDTTLFKSVDALQKLFESGANDFTDLFKTGELSRFESIFKSGDRSEIEKLVKSSEAQKFLSLFQSASSQKLGRSASGGSQKLLPGVFESREWAPTFAPSHVDVDPTKVFRSEDAVASAPQKSTNGTDWEALFESHMPSRLSSYPPPVSRVTRGTSGAGRQSPPSPEKVLSSKTSSKPPLDSAAAPSLPLPSGRRGGSERAQRQPEGTIGASENKRKQKDTSNKVYYEPKPDDVLLGRGGRTNNHSGNKRYLAEKEDIQARYTAATKQEKTGISQELVDRVHAWGGRFLELDHINNKWFEVSAVRARKKAAQTLREINTPEERAAKRARYGK